MIGSGGNVLGHPLEVVAWLANELPRYGLRLSRGDFVTTGVTTDGIYPASAGQHLVAEFPALGRVESPPRLSLRATAPQAPQCSTRRFTSAANAASLNSLKTFQELKVVGSLTRWGKSTPSRWSSSCW